MTIGRTFADGINRASSTSVVTARSSASRTERPSPFSSSARTLARFTGPLSTEGRTRRVSLRLVAAIHTHDTRCWECLERKQTMTSVYTADRLDKHAFSAAISSQFHHEAHSLTTFTQQEVAKKRTRRTVKHQRAIVGASLDVIKERRSQRPEARSAARAAAVKEGKEKKAAAESARKAEKAKNAAASARGNAAKVSKQGAKGAAPKVQARTR